MTLRVEQLPHGRWKLTPTDTPTWCFVAADPRQLVAGFRSAWTEVQITAHSRWRGTEYDAAVAEVDHGRRRRKRSDRKKVRSDVHPATAWLLSGDVDDDDVPMWMSPTGRRYHESAEAVQRVIAKRRAMGLADRPEPCAPDVHEPAVPSDGLDREMGEAPAVDLDQLADRRAA